MSESCYEVNLGQALPNFSIPLIFLTAQKDSESFSFGECFIFIKGLPEGGISKRFKYETKDAMGRTYGGQLPLGSIMERMVDVVRGEIALYLQAAFPDVPGIASEYAYYRLDKAPENYLQKLKTWGESKQELGYVSKNTRCVTLIEELKKLERIIPIKEVTGAITE